MKALGLVRRSSLFAVVVLFVLACSPPGAPCMRDHAASGAFKVRFPLPVMSETDLVRNFHRVLLLLKAQREKVGLVDTGAPG